MKYEDRGGSEHTYGVKTAACHAQRISKEGAITVVEKVVIRSMDSF